MSILDIINEKTPFVHVFAGVSMLIYIILFLIGAIGISKIASNREIKGSKLAFIPILQHVVLGKIADDIVSSRNKMDTSNKNRYARLYPLLSILNPINLVNSLLGVAMHLYLPEQFDPWYFSVNTPGLPHINSIFLGVIEVLLLVTFINMMKEIFDEYDKENTSLFVALSVLFKLHPFILFFMKDRTPFEYKYSKFDDEYYEHFDDFKPQVGD